MKEINVVSCSLRKKLYPCQAVEMYSESVLFKKTINYLKGKSFLILSAKYGIIKPTEKILPYNKTLKDLREQELINLKANIFWNLNDYEIINVFAGFYYVKLIKDSGLKNKINEPLIGLGIGQRLKFLGDNK